ncbi:hypothetical protein [Methanogenium organophilum]|uniref:Transmembrane protein n=1 Tax=Methanogenium organophilum TaxID=2199 RepID=A0A9X9S470_METOG|nr:hypothetical protein [Methanogenium organophilum]WAI01624.1 hypothetical protein OU421_01775 [Methanogenium organophilum]
MITDWSARDIYEHREWFLAGLAVLIFCVPVSIYVIGSMMGAGVQFPLFRYQETYMGANVITIIRDLQYVLEGSITGRSALMPVFWTAGVIFGSFGLFFIAIPSRIRGWYSPRRGGICIMGAGFLYLLALIAQYGPTFSSSGGFAIPVGVPVFIAAGWLVWSGTLFPYADETDVDNPEDSQDISS